MSHRGVPDPAVPRKLVYALDTDLMLPKWVVGAGLLPCDTDSGVSQKRRQHSGMGYTRTWVC